jgi:hypothetical protein
MAAQRKNKARRARLAPQEAGQDRDRGKGILARINVDGLKALRILAIERDTTLQALVVEALNDLLGKYGKRSNVKNPLRD